MARLARIDSQIRGDRPISREWPEGSRTEPVFCESRFGGNEKFWLRRYAERIWGEFFYFGPANFRKSGRRISQRISIENFDCEFFGLVFPGFQATQKIHAQNSRPELSAFLSNFTFLNPKFIHGDFLLAGETKKLRIAGLRRFARITRTL